MTISYYDMHVFIVFFINRNIPSTSIENSIN